MEKRIAENLQLPLKNIEAVLKLLQEGSTIPFIARYRKEMCGGLDEVAIEKIDLENKKLTELESRKKSILERLNDLNINDEELIFKITNCFDSKLLEDLYLPYKAKRKTKADSAKELGLEPLAKIIMSQKHNDLNYVIKRFAINGLSEDEALQGARNIIAEWISENAYVRKSLRRLFQHTAVLNSKLNEIKKDEATKYKDYFDFSQKIRFIPGHRLLAILRAEKEKLLKVKIVVDKNEAIDILERVFIKGRSTVAEHIKLAIKDSYTRLLVPGLVTELRNDAKEKADEEAIAIFSKNLSQLLLASPLGQCRILALDPGFRSGCKLVCLNNQGNLNFHSVIFPHPPQNRITAARQIINELIQKHQIKAIAIGNGTAGRETEHFIREMIKDKKEIEVYMVNEAGASIYSASEIGRKEFPDLDLTVRGAVSIGRRLIDPLAELVKIEPKSIGVGQYQHDVAQDKLKDSLDNTVSFAVNKVGVNLNTASEHLLKYVSGIGPKMAKNIVDYRNENGAFKDRNTLLKIKGFGKKAFEQAAGFLRIKNGDQVLDASAVHPESYKVVDLMAKKIGLKVKDLMANEEATSKIDLDHFVNDKTGLPTLKDIITELNKPGLDPRGKAKATVFDENIKYITDLKVGMELQGKVSNLTKFGAFVDIGIKENGLIHKSQIADRFISDPSEVLKLTQEVKVKVIEIDIPRKRIQLSMKM